MTLRAAIVFILLAAIVVPIVLSEARRFRPRAQKRLRPARPAKPEADTRSRLRLVVNKSEMDRELAALLAKNNRKTSEGDE